MDEDTEGMQFDLSNTESDVGEVESCGSFPRERVEPCTTVEPEEREPNPLKKLVLNAVLDVLENKDDLCIHCGKNGYLKYYYLGIGTKVKNWFKNVDMCRKMLSQWNARDNWLGRQSSNPEKS